MGIVSLEELQSLRPGWRYESWRLVLTNGVFDLLHSGHVSYLEQARLLGEVLVVGLNSDASTRHIKGPLRPLLPEQERATVVAALRCVDYVTVFGQPTAEALVEALRPDVYVKGGDYAVAADQAASAPPLPDADRLPEARVVRAYGGQVVLLPYREGHSTTALIRQIVRRFGHGS
ncbi:MAG: adenylyltransferase/cytidyltransferase family protein [Chloroflexaceae bacterium]|nr:adenylyltransferase/cytidyltransferase family protein [Chloroflexaceae bacterium]